ncbi:NAD(P)/FAD-dependent oxidoreductase [Streptomyces pharetrae]|uniref:NAD(P)/FAD-dependent oxidoreductase n=2 Tax=Streptomyces pharetrae TaxID=291370 RepID=UPI0036675177
MVTFDIAVVGNGVLGLSAALEVARRDTGLRIAVVGTPHRDRAATPAAGAMLNCFGEVTQYTTRHPAVAARFALARRALDAWPDWLARLADEAREAAGGSALRDSHTPGTFVILSARSGRITDENFEAMRSALVEHGEPHEVADPADIPGLAPCPDARPLRALYLQREGTVDARRVLAALEAAAATRGVQFLPATATALVADNGTVRGVRLDDGRTLQAAQVVLAAGSMSGELAATALPPGAVPPMLHGTGLAVLTHRDTPGGVTHAVRTPNRAATCGLHVLPSPGGHYIGATSVITPRAGAGPELGTAHEMLRAACDQIDQQLSAAQVTAWLCGSRPIPLDCFPLLGPSHSLDGLVFATGTYRDGFHCSPVIARYIADVLLDGSTPPDKDLSWFTPERPPVQTMTVPQALDEAVAHCMDAGYEHDLRIPALLGDTHLADGLRQRAEHLYERLPHPIALQPEIIISQLLLPARSPDETQPLTWLSDYLHAARKHHGCLDQAS